MSLIYTIPLSGLKEGRHLIDFEIDNKFFEIFEESEVKEGTLVANIVIDKGSTHSDLSIKITGSVRICCDRCLELFFHPLEAENRLLVKFGKIIEEIDPDILYLPHGENELDLRQHLYEFILLALPIKRVHPEDEEGNSACDPEMLKKLDELKADEESYTDPRWEELKKLMNNN